MFMANAENWQPRIRDAALPQRIVAIDKSKQQFYLFQKNTPFKMTHQYACTTGQVVGDKMKKNDKRTPEGVYFVDYKIDKGLDFKEYGGIAYTLNYPNPVDKLRGKTGYGIWIHSKGEAIKPRITRGCIAIDLENIATVGPLLTSGTAVVVGQSLEEKAIPVADDGTAKLLRKKMEDWSQAWAGRSLSFFDYYNKEAYTKAMSESFTAFRRNKERLFKRLKWINIFNRKVHVLEGPGYWVTWSEQFYRAPNLSVEGIRRLYWQRDEKNVFRIVGMEWIRSDVGMQAAFKKGELVASAGKSAPKLGPADGESPSAPPVSMPEEEVAPQKGRSVEVKVPPVAAPKSLMAIQELKAGEGGGVTSGAVQLGDKGHANAAQKSSTQDGKNTADAQLIAIMQKNIALWQKAWSDRDAKAFYGLYNAELYGKTAGQNYDDAFSQLQDIMSAYFNSAFVQMYITDIKLQTKGDIVVTSMLQWIFMHQKKPREGRHTLYWKKNAQGSWRIVASEWVEKEPSLQVAYLEKVSAAIGMNIESWRKDWLAGDVTAYMAHYTENARQGKRNFKQIATQKQKLWAKNSPAKVDLSGIRIQIADEGLKADMLQIYEGSDGKGDKGTKTLLLVPTAQGWKIKKEDWTKLR